jgi:predicted Fe-Mo cluster-binding NifX family protein
MKIAFTSTGPDWNSIIDSRFGRTEYIILFDEATEQFSAINNASVKNDAHGAGTATSQKVFELKPDVLITGNGPGETALKVLKMIDMRIFIGVHNISIAEAYEAYKNNKLTPLT